QPIGHHSQSAGTCPQAPSAAGSFGVFRRAGTLRSTRHGADAQDVPSKSFSSLLFAAKRRAPFGRRDVSPSAGTSSLAPCRSPHANRLAPVPLRSFLFFAFLGGRKKDAAAAPGGLAA